MVFRVLLFSILVPYRDFDKPLAQAGALLECPPVCVWLRVCQRQGEKKKQEKEKLVLR